MNNYHTPVLLQEVLDLLDVKKGKLYIDATLGGGGHSRGILEKGGRVLGIDVDQDALDYVRRFLQEGENKIENITLVRGNFRDIDAIAKDLEFINVDGILFDLGVSSYQLDTPERGFSFQEGPLDMRMSKDLVVTAKDLVNGLTRNELRQLFERFGEERFAKKIAHAIVEQRKKHPIETTKELADIIKRAVPYQQCRIHPATRVFQALRIVVNDELANIRTALPKALSLLRRGGRIVVISFHSLEDKIVKKQFDEWEQRGLVKIITKKPIVPGREEKLKNRRSRSAKLRAIEKL
jgi:16S rRNA (cytosine1402-N4)-methyltransferase